MSSINKTLEHSSGLLANEKYYWSLGLTTFATNIQK